jgi:acyl-CoA oxidase
MSQVYWGNKETFEQFVKLRDQFAADPILRNHHSLHDMERGELMELGFQKLNRIMSTGMVKIDASNSIMIGHLLNNNLSTSLHSLMFELTVRYLSDDDQVREWLPKILQCKMIGNYCQTELGHGSNVQGLQTTATLDKETDEWVIHSPTV